MNKNQMDSNKASSRSLVTRQKKGWWGRMDSNHRVFWNQIYNLLPSTARPQPRVFTIAQNLDSDWCIVRDLNPGPIDYRSIALPTELTMQKKLISLKSNQATFRTTSITKKNFFRFWPLGRLILCKIPQTEKRLQALSYFFCLFLR